VLRVRGASSLFDVAAVHPYTRTATGVETILKHFRAALDRGAGRSRPMIVDEFGWNSSVGQSPGYYGFETTESGQARNIDTVIRWMASQRAKLHISGFDVYEWANVEYRGAYEFQFAGLLKIVNNVFIPKPALQSYRHDALGMERCRQKSLDARHCAHPA
jgi:hypothetical protein